WKADGKPPKPGLAWFGNRSVRLAVTSSPDFLSARCRHRRKGFKVPITHFRGEIGDPAQINW
ncbi:unnamed protein product, partial [Musa acuminata subsp. burmannicoides]